jgi:monoterpene epsilon-lactone hydrolase
MNSQTLYLRVVTATLRSFIKPLWKQDADIGTVRYRFRLLDRLAAVGRWTPTVFHERISGTDVEWIRPTAEGARGVIVFLHGGAFCVRGERTDRRFCGHISRLTGLPVVLVPYRLAPEYPFPAGLDDCVAVLSKVLMDAGKTSSVVVLGHSAGANLALSAMMQMRDKAELLPTAAVLLSAPTDLTEAAPSGSSNHREDCMIDVSIWRWIARHYIRSSDASNPLVSPVLGIWCGLPPLSLHVSSSELLVNDTLRAVDKAQTSGVKADFHLWEKMPHNFAFLDGLREAKECHHRIAAFINKAITSHSAAREA